ncbi:MAG: hypothetical protein ABI857_03955 [Acidobacteriota bacterium]
MTEMIDQTKWAPFLEEYCAQHKGRPTRLGVFEMEKGIFNDYWIEDGLPLVALDTYIKDGKTRLDIIFENFTHSIVGVTRLEEIDVEGTGRGLDITGEGGRTTVMRFETWPATREE